MGKYNVVCSTMECFLPIKTNAVLIHATTRMVLEHIMLRERKQSQRPDIV